MLSKPQFVGEYRRVKLSEICSKGKSSLRQKDVFNDGPYSVYGASGIVGTTSEYQNETPYVVVVKDGAGVGRASACEPMTSVLGTMQALIPNSNVERDYLLHLVRSLRLGEGFSGSTIPHIYFKDYGRIEVPLPSLEVQKQIVSQLGLVEAQITQVEAQIEQFDQLIKSRFVEMFGNPVDDKLWPHVTLAELCTKLGSGSTPRGGRSTYKTEGIPLIRSMNVHNGCFVWKDLTYIDDDQAAKLNGVTLMKGDVLLNITGASVARSCILPDELAGGRVNQHVSIVRVDQTKMLPIILNMALINDSYQRFLLNDSRMAGATREAITKEDLKSMMVPLPPLSLQQQFANFAAQVDKSRFISMSRYRDILIKNGYRHPHLQGFNR